jgi:hypothetical protein
MWASAWKLDFLSSLTDPLFQALYYKFEIVLCSVASILAAMLWFEWYQCTFWTELDLWLIWQISAQAAPDLRRNHHKKASEG